MRGFDYDAVGGRVIFGRGSRARLASEVGMLGASRVVLIAAEEEGERADEISEALGDLLVGRFFDVAQHVPVERAAGAVELVNERAADAIVSLGGGSATGFGKAIRLDTSIDRGVAFVAVPTTYAGSEMTTMWGRTDGDHKQTGKDPRVKPDTVVYDPELTVSLPPFIAGPSGMNAIAHCVEAMYATGANPIIDLLALEGIRVLADGLPKVCGDDDSFDARSDVLYGAYLAGVALASGGTAIHHKTCHVLGGMFNLNHGDMNAVVLGHALAYTAPAIGDLMPRIGEALGTSGDEAPGALFDLAESIGAPTSLKSIGMPEHGIAAAAERVVVEAAANPQPPELDAIVAMLRDAYEGRRPRTP